MAQPSNVSQVDRVKSVDAALNLVIASLEKEQELKKVSSPFLPYLTS